MVGGSVSPPSVTPCGCLSGDLPYRSTNWVDVATPLGSACAVSNLESIAGVSLERYAELAAEISQTQDPEEQARIVEGLGVPRQSWEAAKQGWTARMQDMNDMGQIASRYMSLYQQALNSKQGTVEVSFEDWAAMEAAIQVFGIQGMLGHYGIDQGTWTQIAGHWTQQLSMDPMRYGVQRNNIQQQEVARLQAGGAPKAVNIQRSAPAQQPAAPAPPEAQQPPPGGLSVGSHVAVQWADGNRYAGTVVQVNDGQAMVSFPSGQQVWVAQRWLSQA